MSRLEVLVHRPRRTLVALAAVLAAVGVAIGSGATFTAQSANPSNTFTAGTLTMSNSKDNAAVLSASNMKPGDTANGTVDIQNTGSVSGTFSLSRSALTNSDSANPMAAKMNLVVRDCGSFASATPTCEASDTEVYSGTLADMSSSEALGTFAADEQHRYQFVATFDSSAGNEYQGDQTSATFQWDAVE